MAAAAVGNMRRTLIRHRGGDIRKSPLAISTAALFSTADCRVPDSGRRITAQSYRAANFRPRKSEKVHNRASAAHQGHSLWPIFDPRVLIPPIQPDPAPAQTLTQRASSEVWMRLGRCGLPPAAGKAELFKPAGLSSTTPGAADFGQESHRESYRHERLSIHDISSSPPASAALRPTSPSGALWAPMLGSANL
jgi:hypothetical protein